MRKRIDFRLLLVGYGMIALVIGGLAVWAAIEGPLPPPAYASVTVPIDIVTPPPESDLPAQPGSGPPGAPPGALPVPPPAAPPPALSKATAPGAASMRPFDKSDARPRIAIVITGLGPSPQSAHAAIELPPEVSLAFLPSSAETPPLAEQARVAGHEILLDVPMEPSNYPDDDPGPEALMLNNSDTENLKRLDWNLGRVASYAGVINFMGSRFTTAEVKLAPVLSELHDKGLIIVDTRDNPLTSVPGLARELKVPYAVADITIDAQAARDSIDQNLAKLEDIARKNGKATGVAGTYPVTFERLSEWARSLPSKGIALAPVSAVVMAPK